jgi:hypothetical protein
MNEKPHTHEPSITDSAARRFRRARVQYGDQKAKHCRMSQRSIERTLARMVKRHDHESLKAGVRASLLTEARRAPVRSQWYDTRETMLEEAYAENERRDRREVSLKELDGLFVTTAAMPRDPSFSSPSWSRSYGLDSRDSQLRQTMANLEAQGFRVMSMQTTRNANGTVGIDMSLMGRAF